MARCASRVATVSHWTAKHHKENAPQADLLNTEPLKHEHSEDSNSGGGKPLGAKNYLEEVIKRTKGLCGIFITDRDGIPILKKSSDRMPSPNPNFLATVSLAVDQAGKLGIGKSKRIICCFESFQVIHFNSGPLMITAIATSKANTGILLNLELELASLLEGLTMALST